MKTAPIAEPGALQTSLLLLARSDSSGEVSTGDAVLPLIWRSHRQGWNMGFRGLRASVAAIAGVAAIAAVYLMFWCAVHLARGPTSKTALRFLAGAEGEKSKEWGESCISPAEDPPAVAASATAVEEDELVEGDAVENHLLKRASLYAVELRRLISNSESVLRKLDNQLRARCIAAFLCLSVVELSALLSLLEGRERNCVQREICVIYRRIWALRDSLGSRSVSVSRQRHIKCLHILLGRLRDVKPAVAVHAERQRQLRIKRLLQLQEVALRQLGAGLFWLRISLQTPMNKIDDANTAAAAPESAARAIDGDASTAESGAGSPEGTDTAPDGAALAIHTRVVAVVKAIEITVHKRRGQVLLDAFLSRWLREVHVGVAHYGITMPDALERIINGPPKAHRELFEALQATPLGAGNEPWENWQLEDANTKQKTPSTSAGEASSRRKKVSTEKSARAPRDAGRLNSFHRSSQIETAAGGFPSVCGSPTATTSHAAQGRHRTLQETISPTTVSSSAESALPPQVPSPPKAGHRQANALPASLGQAAVFASLSRNPRAPPAFRDTSASFSARVFEFSSSTVAFQIPSPVPFRAAVSSTPPHSSEAFTQRKTGVVAQLPVAPADVFGSEVSIAALAHVPVSPDNNPLPEGSVPPLDALESSVEASVPRLGPSFLVSAHQRVDGALVQSTGEARGDWSSQAKGTQELAFQDPEKFMLEPSISSLQASPSRPVPASISTDVESRLTSDIQQSGSPVDIYGTPINFREWALPPSVPDRFVEGLLTNTEPDAPNAATVAAGFAALAKLFSGSSDQQSGWNNTP